MKVVFWPLVVLFIFGNFYFVSAARVYKSNFSPGQACNADDCARSVTWELDVTKGWLHQPDADTKICSTKEYKGSGKTYPTTPCDEETGGNNGKECTCNNADPDDVGAPPSLPKDCDGRTPHPGWEVVSKTDWEPNCKRYTASTGGAGGNDSSQPPQMCLVGLPNIMGMRLACLALLRSLRYQQPNFLQFLMGAVGGNRPPGQTAGSRSSIPESMGEAARFCAGLLRQPLPNQGSPRMFLSQPEGQERGASRRPSLRGEHTPTGYK